MEPWQYPARIPSIRLKLPIVLPCSNLGDAHQSDCRFGSQEFISRLCLFVVFYPSGFCFFFFVLTMDRKPAIKQSVLLQVFDFLGKPQPSHTHTPPIYAYDFWSSFIHSWGMWHSMGSGLEESGFFSSQDIFW